MDVLEGALLLFILVGAFWALAKSERGTKGHDRRRRRPVSGSARSKRPAPFDESSARPLHHSKTLSGPAWITDGDTLTICKTQIRLFGIDAPEPSQWCGDESDIAYRCGWEATFFLAEIFEGRTVECVDTEAYQNFQRAVRCYFEDEERDRIDINATMVRAGHALAYRRYSDEFAEHEQTARAARRGMWRGAFQAPWDWRRLNRSRR